MAWVGGKKALRDEILARFPLDYKRYIEVFGGVNAEIKMQENAEEIV